MRRREALGLLAASLPLSAARAEDKPWHDIDVTGASPSLDFTMQATPEGQTVFPASYIGFVTMLYFGYTFCPDVCPTDLMAITQALDALGPAAADVQPIFITIDPERDTKVLADYVAAFHRSFVGLTGSPDEIRKVANSYKAFYAKVPGERGGEYSIDHAGVIYLMGRNGEYLGFMPPQTGPDRLSEILRKYLAN